MHHIEYRRTIHYNNNINKQNNLKKIVATSVDKPSFGREVKNICDSNFKSKLAEGVQSREFNKKESNQNRNIRPHEQTPSPKKGSQSGDSSQERKKQKVKMNDT